MKNPIALYSALAALFAATACEKPPPPSLPTALPEVTAPTASMKVVKATSFTFTKVPAAFADHSITSPVPGLEAIVFRMDATSAAGIVVKQFGFMISGSLQAGNVRNYQLAYYPNGLTKPSVVMGTNDGSTWVAPGGQSFIYINLAAPITIPKGATFTAYFALRADVVGTGAFFFYPRVQTCTVNEAGVDKDVLWLGGDLPLQGDTYRVN